MIGVAHACHVVCMVFLQNEIMGMVTMVFFGAEWLLNWMTVENTSTASLCLFDCINLILHNIVNHGVTKSKQYYIKSMAEHDGLSYYHDFAFVVLSGNVASWCFGGCALCVVWIAWFSHSGIPT
jgi:hypothetical protein